MKVFMLGWEFPPYISGGLGTACYGLTKGMSQVGIEIIFLLPRPVETPLTSHVKMASPVGTGSNEQTKTIPYNFIENLTFRHIDSPLQPYETSETYFESVDQIRKVAQLHTKSTQVQQTLDRACSANYGSDLYQEVHRYAQLATVVAQQEQFDVIHAHDWMTFLAGVAVSRASGKPLIVHVHSTEFDRSGANPNPQIRDIEQLGLESADQVITVSRRTLDIVVNHYNIEPKKITVVYNAIDQHTGFTESAWASPKRNEKIVLFLGRITMQKGPEYFLEAAQKVLDVMADVRFIMAGSGDMTHRMIEKAAAMGIGHKVQFTGFLQGGDVNRAFKMADLFVMPSVSEPFGLVPLEALRNDVPVLVSNQSGVSEVLTHALKVDFWDIDEMANKMIAVLKYPALHTSLRDHGNFEVRRFSWKDSARQCLDVYESALGVSLRGNA